MRDTARSASPRSRDPRAAIETAGLAMLLAATIALAAAPTVFAADPSGPTVIGAKVTFYGRGFGHGVGMSQYGARGRAVDGQDAATILTHYYRGTTLAPLTTPPDIRVLVLNKWTASAARALWIYGRGTAWSIDGIDGSFPADARLSVLPRFVMADGVTTTTWWLKVRAPTGEALLSQAAPAARFFLRGVDDTTRFELASKPGSYDLYRGTLRVITTQSAGKVSVVDTLPLEQYLRGVVPAEMPSTWPVEALRSQAIASRSYAIRKLRRDVSYYDTNDDSRSQVYRGARAEKASTDAAISDTADVVLWSGTTVANALYHSTGGGATENNENAFVSATGKRIAGKLTYLRGLMDRRDDGSAYDELSPYATWSTKTYSRATLSAWFAADPRTDVGALKSLDLHRRGVSGRLISVILIGSTGRKQVSGDVFRAVFDAARPAGDPMLRSTLFDTKPVP